MSGKQAAARELGAEIARLRKAAGLSLRQLATVTGFSDTKISFWETGDRLPSIDDLNAALDALGTSDQDRERLTHQRREADGPGLLLVGAPSVGESLAQLVDQEQTAKRITTVSSLLIPGLLQTPDYARVMFEGMADANTRVVLRMGRQTILSRKPTPVELHAIIDSEVLVRPIGAPDVMVAQLRHLLAMAQLPNITVQVISSTSRGYSPHLAGAFILIEFPNASPIVHLEHHSASTTLWERADVNRYIEAAAQLTEKALTPARTTEFLEEIVKGMDAL